MSGPHFTPSIMIWGIAGFLAALAIHILVWRWNKPPREMTWLVIIFLILPAAAYTAAHFLAGCGPQRICLAFIWHAALASAYIMTYPPIQAGCPSLKIVLAVRHAGKVGMSRDEVFSLFSEEGMFSDRFNDLIEEGLISWKYDTWGISGVGRLIARFFIFYRKLLKLPLGEG